MKISLIGAELEENLGLRYIASALEHRGHSVDIVPFNSEYDIPHAVKQVIAISPQITGLSMVFTGRGREFCHLAQALRDGGYAGHIIAGGHFAAFNCQQLLKDFQALDSVALGEGEDILCALADSLDKLSQVPGLCYRQNSGSVVINPSTGNPDNLDALFVPKRATFHEYFGKPIASILSSRGCWRNCAFCSINAWYKSGGGKKFRIRSLENLVAEMKELYFRYGIRIFNFQDDNFFLPNPEDALHRFEALRALLQKEGVEGIAIAIKARPDSITKESIQVLDDLGLFRVFLGVENASENGLRKLNRKCTPDQILNALQILNDFDVHIAYNLLMFEPDTVLDDILINLRFIERHVDNPFNFCRAEAYAGTGLETKLVAEGRLLGNYFGFDYRLKDPRSEAFHQIANYAFFDRNFSDSGLHYFNMQVDFSFQLLRRFHPEVLTQTLRAAVRNFIKQTNIDTYQCLCQIYDFVAVVDPSDHATIRTFAREVREHVDERSAELHAQGEIILHWLNDAYERSGRGSNVLRLRSESLAEMLFLGCKPVPYSGLDGLGRQVFAVPMSKAAGKEDLFEITPFFIPYNIFKSRMSQQKE
jgi:anaerobic magnesium-protoporphyrin IX monomethyl ester cyclase